MIGIFAGVTNCCMLFRWKIEYGKAWQHLGGDLHGQTQVSYCNMNPSETLPFAHPVDAHFAAAGLQVCALLFFVQF